MTEMIDDTGGSDLTTLMTQAFTDNPQIEGGLTPAEYLELWVWGRCHSRKMLVSGMAFLEVLSDPRAPALFASAMRGMLQELHHSDDDDEFAPPPSTTNTTPPIH